MNRETIDKWLGHAMVALVCAALVFGVAALGAVRLSEFVVVHWLILAAATLWIVRIWIAPQYRFLMPPTLWAILPFVAYAVWRYRSADIEYVARQELLQVLIAAVLFLVIVNNLFGQTETRILMVSLICLGTLVAMYGTYQWLTASHKVWHFVRPTTETRGSGTYICANHLAGFLEMMVPVALALTVLRGFGVLARVFLAYASFVMLVGIASTGSRAGWLSAAVGLFVLVLVMVRKKSQRWTGLALLVLACGIGGWLYGPALQKRVNSTPQPNARFDDVRFRLWDTAQQMWKENPWFGVGPGHFDHRYRGYRQAHSEAQGRPAYAHNDYLNTLADWGLVGLILILAPVAVAAYGVRLSWRNLHRSGDIAAGRVAVVLGAGVGLVSLLVHSFFDFNMHIPANALVAVALLAIITAHWRFASQRYWITARWPIRVVATLALVGAVGCLTTQAWQQSLEVRALARADRLRAASPAKVEALKGAFAVEPRNPETARAIADELRSMAWAGGEDYRRHAREAVEWYERTAKLNRWDSHSLVGAGMCLDWIEEHDKALPYFERALQLDPNHWYTRGMAGWHYFQAENFSEAEHWLEQSLKLNHYSMVARTYFDLAKKNLRAGTNSPGPFPQRR